MVIGRNPEGTIDRAVDVIRVDDLEGATLATMLSAACHPIVLGPTCDGWHPDFVGPARALVERTTGTPCLFLQGAGGNIMPDVGMGGEDDRLQTTSRWAALLLSIVHRCACSGTGAVG